MGRARGKAVRSGPHVLTIWSRDDVQAAGVTDVGVIGLRGEVFEAILSLRGEGCRFKESTKGHQRIARHANVLLLLLAPTW